MDSAAGITAAMRECYSFEIECQDKRMNYNYKNHLVSIDVDIRKKILTLNVYGSNLEMKIVPLLPPKRMVVLYLLL